MRLLRTLLITGTITASLAVPVPVSADTPTAGPVTSPFPSPTAPIPTYEGRPCASGTLINDFIVLGDREPQPSCVEPFTPEGPEVLLGIYPLPAGLVLRGVERSIVGGVSQVAVIYESVSGVTPGRDRVSIALQRESLSKPYPVSVLQKVSASRGDFLPTPGLLLEPSAANQIGLWFGASGRYRMDIESPGLPLEIRDLSQRLVPVDALGTPIGLPPNPPATGSGAAQNSSNDVAWLFGVAGVSLILGLWVLRSALRRPQ